MCARLKAAKKLPWEDKHTLNMAYTRHDSFMELVKRNVKWPVYRKNKTKTIEKGDVTRQSTNNKRLRKKQATKISSKMQTMFTGGKTKKKRYTTTQDKPLKGLQA